MCERGNGRVAIEGGSGRANARAREREMRYIRLMQRKRLDALFDRYCIYVWMKCDGQRVNGMASLLTAKKYVQATTNVCAIVCIEQQLKRNWATKNKWGASRAGIGVCVWRACGVVCAWACKRTSQFLCRTGWIWDGGSVAIIVVGMCSREPAVIYAYVYDIWYSMFALTEMTGQ